MAAGTFAGFTGAPSGALSLRSGGNGGTSSVETPTSLLVLAIDGHEKRAASTGDEQRTTAVMPT